MIPMDVPSDVWHTIGADIFHLKGKIFLLVTIIRKRLLQLNNSSAEASINATKSVFSENGIPYKLVSDNNPFNSHEYEQFAKQYGFVIVPSSPEYPRDMV